MGVSMKQVVSLPIESIQSISTLRPVREDAIASLVESLQTIGLQTPISVIANDDGDGYLVVTGNHRLQAAQAIGWTHIDAFILEDEETATLWEISENLHRADLSQLERARLIVEWAKQTRYEIFMEQERVLTQSAPKPKGGRPQGGIRAVARELNLDRDYVRRSLKIASLSQDAQETAQVVGLANNRTALLEAADLPENEQSAYLLGRAKQIAVHNEEKARFDRFDFSERQYNALRKAWNNASYDVRGCFMHVVGLVFKEQEQAPQSPPQEEEQ